MKRSYLLCLGLASIVTLGGCTKKEISEKPPHAANAEPSFTTASSQVAATLTSPMSQVRGMIENAVPPSYSTSGNGDDVCARVIGARVCAGTHFAYTVSRGNITIVAQSPSAVMISVPVSLRGQGGFRGDGARLLSLQAKNFTADAILDLTVAPRLNADWCPVLDVRPGYRWISNPRVEIVSRAWIDVKGPIEAELNKKIPEIVEKARTAIDCAKFRADVSKFYASQSFPLPLPWNDQLHVNLDPQDIAFSGLVVDPAKLQVAASLAVKAEIAGKPIAKAPKPLPKLKPLGPGVSPRLSLAVPVRAPYPALATALSEGLKGKTFTKDTPAGALSATVNEVELYPSNDRLVIGLDFVADMPGRILDAKGQIYLLGTPVVDGGTAVSLKNVGFARILDNDLWSGLSALFEADIREAIEKAVRYDLAADINKAKAELKNKLADPQTTPGVKLTANNVAISLGRVAVAPEELAVEALFSATVTVTPL